MATTINEKFIEQTALYITNLINRPLHPVELRDLPHYINENKKYIVHLNEQFDTTSITKVELITVIAVRYANILESDITADDSIIIPTKTVNINNILGINNIGTFLQQVNPAIFKKTAYLSLDSRYAQFSTDCKKLQWNIFNAITDQQNSADLVGEIKNITKIRCNSLVINGDVTAMQRASILIEELTEQSFILPNGRHFHFLGKMYDFEEVPNPKLENEISPLPIFYIAPDVHDKAVVYMDRSFNDGNYRFNKPITVLNTITISIGNPMDLIVIPKYEYINCYITPAADSFFYVDLPEEHYLSDVHGGVEVNYTYENYYSIMFDNVQDADDPNEQWFPDLLMSKEWNNVTIIGNSKLRVSGQERPPGWDAHTTVVDSLPNQPEQLSFTCNVRINTMRIMLNLELEYNTSL